MKRDKKSILENLDDENPKVIKDYCYNEFSFTKWNREKLVELPHGYTIRYSCEDCGDRRYYRVKSGEDLK